MREKTCSPSHGFWTGLYPLKKHCSICGDAATETCQYCGVELCTNCKTLERDCFTFRMGKKKKKGAK